MSRAWRFYRRMGRRGAPVEVDVPIRFAAPVTITRVVLWGDTRDEKDGTPNPAAATAPYNNAKFLAALFSNDSISSKRNTEAVEAAPSTLIAGRIVEFNPMAERVFRYTREEVLAMRKQYTNPGIFTIYREPLMIVEGHMQYVFDETGKGHVVEMGAVPRILPRAGLPAL